MKITTPYVYSIEIFNKNIWITQIRFYSKLKKLTDFDLHDIKNKRKNAKYLGKIIRWK